jgi:tetratricopeptide (TPR) repeat protein
MMITIDIPIWAARLRAQRRAHLWNRRELGKQMADASDESTRDHLPGQEGLAGMVRSWEAGEQRPDELHAELLCRAFGTDETDLFVGDAAGTTLWHHLTGIPLMTESFSAEEEERTGRAIEDPQRADDQTAAYFATILRTYALMDHHPAGLADALSPVFDTIEGLHRDVGSGIRQALLLLSSQDADLVSRMHYEAGNLSEALAWSDRALTAAHRAGDEHLVAYALAHRAGLRDTQDNPGQVIDLAVAARERVAPPAPLDAMARRHEAQGHAMAGAEDMCHRRLEESAESPETPGDDLPYMVDYPAGLPNALAAGCLIELHHPADAIEILERDLRGAPAGYMTAYTMARLAHAYADAYESERSAAIAREAFDLSRRTGATRALQELRLIQDDIHQRMPRH